MYLPKDLLLREDAEESLQMVKTVIKVFRCFTDCYQTQRMKLASHVKHAPWDFPSVMVFARFNQFLNRMLQLEVRFLISVFLFRCLTFKCYATLICNYVTFFPFCLCRTCLKSCLTFSGWKVWSLGVLKAKPTASRLLRCLKSSPLPAES